MGIIDQVTFDVVHVYTLKQMGLMALIEVSNVKMYGPPNVVASHEEGILIYTHCRLLHYPMHDRLTE